MISNLYFTQFNTYSFTNMVVFSLVTVITNEMNELNIKHNTFFFLTHNYSSKTNKAMQFKRSKINVYINLYMIIIFYFTHLIYI